MTFADRILQACPALMNVSRLHTKTIVDVQATPIDREQLSTFSSKDKNDAEDCC